MNHLFQVATISLLQVTYSSPQWEELTNFVETLVGDEEPGEVNGAYEELPYTTVKRFQDYEERIYDGVSMVCANMTHQILTEEEEYSGIWNLVNMVKKMTNGEGKKEPSNKMFMKLFRYISGVNVDYQEIEMTVPVLTTLEKMENMTMFQKMCFYIPSEFQDSTPQPLELGVTIEQLQKMTVYVHQFGGYAMSEMNWWKHCEQFLEVLSSAGVSDADPTQCLTAGYDSPMKFWNRRNEVMWRVNRQN